MVVFFFFSTKYLLNKNKSFTTNGFVEIFEIWSVIALKLLDESIYFLASISCIVLDFQNVSTIITVNCIFLFILTVGENRPVSGRLP